MIEKGSKVKLHYTLKVEGEVIDSTKEREPLTYVHGSAQLIPGLEEGLEGREEGETMGLKLPPERAYGRWNPGAVRTVPVSAFSDPERIAVGRRVQGETNGRSFEASVTEVDADKVTLDLNHPLAGKTLEFEVEVVEVK